MLILTLKLDETIRIGEHEVMLCGVGIRGMALRGVQVKLGITAPPEVRVHRGKRVAGRKP